MNEPVQCSVEANGVRLNVHVLDGPQTSDLPPVVMLHGMRDVGLSLMPIATKLAADRRVYVTDLRGHGGSDQPGNYAMVQLVFDLHCIMTRLVKRPAVIFGHSLGGHVACRFAALYPELAIGLVVAEGLGPPDRRHDGDASERLRLQGQRILETLNVPQRQRPLPSVAFAAERLLANNPRLTPERAETLARQATVRNSDGELNWAFDQRVGSVFVGIDPDDTARYWSEVRCPVCVVSGAQSAEYWGRAIQAGSTWTGEFAAGELDARVARFPHAEHVILRNSGHMVHFDEPDGLAGICQAFLNKHARGTPDE